MLQKTSIFHGSRIYESFRVCLLMTLSCGEVAMRVGLYQMFRSFWYRYACKLSCRLFVPSEPGMGT